MINEVELQLGPYREPATFSLTRHTLITGPVGQGKTTVLRGIRLAFAEKDPTGTDLNPHAPFGGDEISVRVTTTEGNVSQLRATRRTKTTWLLERLEGGKVVLPQVNLADVFHAGPRILERMIVERFGHFPEDPIEATRNMLRLEDERKALDEAERGLKQTTRAGRLIEAIETLDSMQRAKASEVSRLEKEADAARPAAQRAAIEEAPAAGDLDPLAIRLLVKARSADDHPDDCPVCWTRTKGLGKRLKAIADRGDAPVARGAFRDREAALREAHEAGTKYRAIASVRKLLLSRMSSAQSQANATAIGKINKTLPAGLEAFLLDADRGGLVWGLRVPSGALVSFPALSGWQRATLAIAVLRAYAPSKKPITVLLDDDDLAGFSEAALHEFLLELLRSPSIEQVIACRHDDRVKSEGIAAIFDTVIRLGEPVKLDGRTHAAKVKKKTKAKA